jgi:UDP-glucose 4-epimerase
VAFVTPWSEFCGSQTEVGKVLITGVGGFIGSHVARRFLQEGWEVVGVDDLSNGKKKNIPPGTEWIQGDLSQKETFNILPAGCQKILHLAGQSSGEISFDNPVADLEKNTTSTLNLLHYAMKNKAERLVYASSMSVYGSVPDFPISETHPCRPLSCYGVGKRASEFYLEIFGSRVPWVSLRMFNVYGPGQDLDNLRQGMVSIYLAQAVRKGKVVVKGGLQRFRDFIFIDDVVESWFRAATEPTVLGEFINVGTGVRTTVEELLGEIKKLVPTMSMEVLGNTPGDQQGIYADCQKMKNLLRYSSCTPLRTGLPRFLEWIQNQS